MSLKVLVANENVEQNSLYCNYLTNDRDFDVISTKDGIETLNAYTQVRPSIFILDSFFSDLKYTDILDKLTNLDNERNKCNTVITVNNDKEQLLLRNAKKVHSILKKPLFYLIFLFYCLCFFYIYYLQLAVLIAYHFFQLFVIP